MAKVVALLGIIAFIVIGCGPETIFVRPGLDTPALHLSNGHRFLEQEKWEDARREFERAKHLDPFNTEAFIGLAVAYGRQGDVEKGFELLEDARCVAAKEEDLLQIQKAHEQLRRLKTAP
jgi:thioredoxin-like negative regulator of GroEL